MNDKRFEKTAARGSAKQALERFAKLSNALTTAKNGVRELGKLSGILAETTPAINHDEKANGSSILGERNGGPTIAAASLAASAESNMQSRSSAAIQKSEQERPKTRYVAVEFKAKKAAAKFLDEYLDEHLGHGVEIAAPNVLLVHRSVLPIVEEELIARRYDYRLLKATPVGDLSPQEAAAVRRKGRNAKSKLRSTEGLTAMKEELQQQWKKLAK